jgi:uncharacterized membrane protein YphA (DoxX/SURF4 family)
MNTWTRIGLVLLRVVIGWHFLFEGLEKLEATWNHQGRLVFSTQESWVLEHVFGESKKLDKKGSWSAELYLREAQGPLAAFFREQAGDPDTRALELLNTPSQADTLPPALEAEWKDRFDRFAAHYELGQNKAVQPEYVGTLAVDALAPFPGAVPWASLDRAAQTGPLEAVQRTLTEQDYQIARQQAATWLRRGSRDVPSKLPGVDGKVHETTPERIALYKKKLGELSEIENRGMPAFEQDVWKDKYRALKQEIATTRTELLRDLNKPFDDTLKASMARLSKDQRDKGAVPDPEGPLSSLDWINFVTRWGLTLVGVGLVLGLFTRTSCVVGAGFLLVFCLAMPALPWLPANPRAEGHYLYVNKNIIELIALLTLATTQSGKWLGLDGFVQFLNPWRWRRAAPRSRPARQQPVMVRQ